jgi:small subunit ribosomal protein S6e
LFNPAGKTGRRRKATAVAFLLFFGGWTKAFPTKIEVYKMANFKFVISDGKKSYQFEKDQKDSPVFGKKIGDKMDGDFLGLEGYELEITGGSDKDGFPMRKDVEGQLRKKFLITKGVGFNTDIDGLKRRRMLRGNSVGEDISQVNCKVVKRGDVNIDEIAPKKEKKQE